MTQTQNVAILIDGSNIEVSLYKKFNQRGLMLNYDTFIPEIVKERNLSKLFYFREGANISSKFSNRLKETFFGVCEACGKSADMHLAVKAIILSEQVNTIIIISGDVDYTPVILYLRNKGIRVEIICVEETGSKSLLRLADSYTFINENHLYKFQK